MATVHAGGSAVHLQKTTSRHGSDASHSIGGEPPCLARMSTRYSRCLEDLGPADVQAAATASGNSGSETMVGRLPQRRPRPQGAIASTCGTRRVDTIWAQQHSPVVSPPSVHRTTTAQRDANDACVARPKRVPNKLQMVSRCNLRPCFAVCAPREPNHQKTKPKAWAQPLLDRTPCWKRGGGGHVVGFGLDLLARSPTHCDAGAGLITRALALQWNGSPAHPPALTQTLSRPTRPLPCNEMLRWAVKRARMAGG